MKSTARDVSPVPTENMGKSITDGSHIGQGKLIPCIVTERKEGQRFFHDVCIVRTAIEKAHLGA